MLQITAQHESRELYFTISLGVATFEVSNSQPEDWLGFADDAVIKLSMTGETILSLQGKVGKVHSLQFSSSFN